MLANRLTQRMSDGVVLAGSLVLSAATQSLLWATSGTVLAVTLIAVSSLSFGIWNVVAVSMRQRLSPSRLLGRVNATYNTVAVGAAPIGAILGGVAAAQWGIRAPFLIGVPALMAGAVLATIRLR
jgi:predicted MFS family arabinose efflux permease